MTEATRRIESILRRISGSKQLDAHPDPSGFLALTDRRALYDLGLELLEVIARLEALELEEQHND